MADELAAFRECWKRELTSKKEEQRLVSAASPSRSTPAQSGHRDSKNRYFEDLKNPSKGQSEACSPSKSAGCTEDEGRVGGGRGEAEAESEDQPEYVSIARSLLDGRTSPLLDRIQEERSRRKRQYHNMTDVCRASLQQQQQPQRKAKKDKELVEQLIQDLNEVNDIPFFDIELPYELALKIFQYLNCTELGRCAQVSGRGCVDLWSTETGGEPIHHYQIPGRIQALALSPDSPVLGYAAGSDVRLDRADDRGYWRTLCQVQLPKTVESLVLVPGRKQQCPLAALAAGEAVYLLDPLEEEPRTLHSVYDHPVTCLDASDSNVAFGVKRTGWAMHDGGNKIHVYSLETGKPTVCVGNSPGDFTCINLRDSPPHLLVCGNKDRRKLKEAKLTQKLLLNFHSCTVETILTNCATVRVRVFDLRSGSSVASLYAHHLGVTSVQADDWKIVSGGEEGLVCVWETRMGAKLWEMHNRHPVRHIHFNTSTLVTANIPDDKSPRGACITDDDLTAHRRHRGVICHYDFSEDASSQDHILPICRSDYTESYGYNYNIGLTVPYDRLSGSHPSH
eukprot:superscaffoldBa00000239_g3031